MIVDVSFAFPTENGYQFYPSDSKNEASILGLLTPDDENWSDEISISPFVRATWVGRFPFLPQNKAIFLVGVISRGIKNNVHRGSYSVWTTATIVQTKRSFSEENAKNYLEKLLDELRCSVTPETNCVPFFQAINKYLIQPAGREILDNALA